MTSVQNITILAQDAGQRLDNYLIKKLKGVPESKIYNIIRKGEIRVNSSRVKPLYHLKAGDKLRIPPIRTTTKTKQLPSAQLISLIQNSILFEDRHLVIINKPSGLAVHGGTGVAIGLIDVLKQVEEPNTFLELAHRIDRDTSGCVIVAKDRRTLLDLQEIFKHRQITKIYLALTKGHWKNENRTVKLSLLKNRERSGERVSTVSSHGKESLTDFKVLKHFKLATLVEAKILTGRTHQIRVHAEQIGHPVAGDQKYGDKEFNAQMKKMGLSRLFLHAERLEFTLPNGQHISVSAPLDERLTSVLNRLS